MDYGITSRILNLFIIEARKRFNVLDNIDYKVSPKSFSTISKISKKQKSPNMHLLRGSAEKNVVG